MRLRVGPRWKGTLTGENARAVADQMLEMLLSQPFAMVIADAAHDGELNVQAGLELDMSYPYGAVAVTREGAGGKAARLVVHCKHGCDWSCVTTIQNEGDEEYDYHIPHVKFGDGWVLITDCAPGGSKRYTVLVAGVAAYMPEAEG